MESLSGWAQSGASCQLGAAPTFTPCSSCPMRNPRINSNITRKSSSSCYTFTDACHSGSHGMTCGSYMHADSGPSKCCFRARVVEFAGNLSVSYSPRPTLSQKQETRRLLPGTSLSRGTQADWCTRLCATITVHCIEPRSSLDHLINA